MRKSRLFNDLLVLVLPVLVDFGRRFGLAGRRWSTGLAQSSLIHSQHDFIDCHFDTSLTSLAQANDWLVSLADDISPPFPVIIGIRGISLGHFDYLERLGFPERSVHLQYFWRGRSRHHTLLALKFLSGLLNLGQCPVFLDSK